MKDLWFTWGKGNTGMGRHKVAGRKVIGNTILENKI
jgi:hypothetical protein